MSGIAEILLSTGYKVSGSDVVLSSVTERLTSLGASVYQGHHQKHIQGATVLVYSSAIGKDNPELIHAREKKIPIMVRAEMLAELMRLKKGVAIAGTHGKTTTTSMLATILQEKEYDPTYIVGGIVSNLKGHAQVGAGEFLIAEADESDGSFLLLNPHYSVITNIDNDHLDYYDTEEALLDAFEQFANQIPFDGLCAINAQDKKLVEMSKRMKKPFTSFGIKGCTIGEADFYASDLRCTAEHTHFKMHHENRSVSVQLAALGQHNVLNFLGAAAVAVGMGLELEEVAHGVLNFKGVGRRFQTLLCNKDMEIVDDYGHHPTEIEITIDTLRKHRPDKKIVVFFEPHRFSRTRNCWDQFLHCFNSADKVYIAPIYPASELPMAGISSARLSEDINKLHPGLMIALSCLEDMKDILSENQNKNWTVLSLGAGSIGQITREWVREYADNGNQVADSYQRSDS